MTECMFLAGDDCPAARELADLDRQIDLRMKAEAENNRLREALKEAQAWMIDGMSSYKWLEAYKVISTAITQEPPDEL
jgi:hypothetical protein